MLYQDTNPMFASKDLKLKGIQYEKDSNAAYGDHIKNVFSICNTSAAHTYGNVSAVVEKYILDLFPPDTFRTITASTSLASRQITHTPKQIVKKSLPSFVISPRIDFGQDDNRFLGHTIFNDRYNNIFSQYGDGSLIPLANDKLNNINIYGHYNRAVIYFDIVLGFSTFVEQTNWMGYLHNVVPLQHPFDIKAPLELYIPMEFCKLISELTHTDLKDNNGSVKQFMSKMNSFWYHPITYKLKGSSNTDEFFMYYITNILTTIQDPQPQQGIKDGQIRRNFDISFTVRCEFNTIGYFLINSPELKHPKEIITSEADHIIPMFSDHINLDEFTLPVGWKIIDFPIFKLNFNEDGINFSPILNNTLNTMIDYHLSNAIPLERFIKIQFRENGSILENEEYYIDWHKRYLKLIYPDTHRTYRLLITANIEYINELIKTVYNLE